MKLQWIQARLNLWKPRWTADPPAVDKTVAMVMISHPTRGTMWIVIGEVDKGKRLFLFWSSDYFSLFFFFLGPVDHQCDTRTRTHTRAHTRLPAAPCAALTDHQLCYCQVFFFSFRTFWRRCFSVTCRKCPHRSRAHHGWVTLPVCLLWFTPCC